MPVTDNVLILCPMIRSMVVLVFSGRPKHLENHKSDDRAGKNLLFENVKIIIKRLD